MTDTFQIFLKTLVDSKTYIFEVNKQLTVKDLKIKWQERTGMPWDHIRLIFAGKQLEDKQTLASYNIQKESTLHAIERQVGDIGYFDYHSSSYGKNYLLLSPKELLKISQEKVIELIQNIPLPSSSLSLNKITSEQKKEIFCHNEEREIVSTITTPLFISDCLNEKECESIITHIESQKSVSSDVYDFQLNLTQVELESLLTVKRVQELFALFQSPVHNIRIRKVSSNLLEEEREGKCINFHLDYAKKTMQIALNEDYLGGRLVFATKEKGFECPKRGKGFGSIHNNQIVHGVTPLEKGVRYGLFFLNYEE